jgi:hypothetical protein
MRKAAERDGKLRAMSFRTTSELSAKLEDAASKAGRSLTSEIERRLELSFVWEKAHGDVHTMLAESKAAIEKATRDNERVLAKQAASRGGFFDPVLEQSVRFAVSQGVSAALEEHAKRTAGATIESISAAKHRRGGKRG